MGCFEELVIPWKRDADLAADDPDVGPHLAENFRQIDRWGNSMHDSCGGSCIYLASLGNEMSVDGMVEMAIEATFAAGARLKVDAFFSFESVDGLTYLVDSSLLSPAFVQNENFIGGAGKIDTVSWTGVFDKAVAGTYQIPLRLSSTDDSDFQLYGGVMTGVMGSNCGVDYPTAS